MNLRSEVLALSIARGRLTAGSAILLLLASLVGVAEPADDVDFRRDIAPILARHCVRCHRADDPESPVSLETPAALLEQQYVVPGDAEASGLLAVVQASDGQRPAMPKSGEPLTAEQVALLTRWIEEGAEWPADVRVQATMPAGADWWSLQPIRAMPAPAPPAGGRGWALNEIDLWIESTLRQRGLQPSPPAEKRALIRRATFDLTGLPPTPEEVERFLSDGSPDAYERLIDRLLASPAYGERWGRHWLDVVRFGESRGFERNEIITNLWPFRDYVIGSFNDDKPMDRLIHEHLAGDQLAPDCPEIEVGTAFLVCGPYDDVGNQDPVQAAQIRADTLDEIIRSTTEAFLGLTVGCARCHDHKFDPITQQDYYRLYATFAGVQHGARAVGTAAERKAVRAAREPLEARHAQLAAELQQLESQVAARAESIGEEVDRRATRPPADRRGTRESFPPVAVRFVQLVVFGSESNPAVAQGYTIDEFEVWSSGSAPRNVALASLGAEAEGASPVAKDFVSAYSAALAIDGRWGARWLAAGPTLTIKLADIHTIDAVTFSSDRQGDAGDHGVANFVADYEIRVSIDGQHWQTVARSHDRLPINDAHRQHRRREAAITDHEREEIERVRRQLSDVAAELQRAPRLDVWWIGQMQPADGPFHVFLGGDPQRTGPTVEPAGLTVLEPRIAYHLSLDEPEGTRRRALAEWILHAEQPLTARVLANRIWHYHFGTGIVATPNDFGAMGQPPTHPELLDGLALRLQQDGWRLKPLHRLIMLSQTYRQSSAYRADAAAQDGQTRYLWRFPPRRLSGEELRDAMLAVSGQLDRHMGGPGFRLYQYLQDNVATYVPLDEHGPETYRRAVYHHNARAARVDLLSDFDCPDSAFSAPRRETTTTATQALALMNHDFTHEMAEAFARRVEADVASEAASGTVARQIDRAFHLALARPASHEEQREAAERVRQFGLRALCRALLNCNEFLYLE